MMDEALRGMEKNLEIKGDGVYYFMNQIWTPKFSGYRVVVNILTKSAHFLPIKEIYKMERLT